MSICFKNLRLLVVDDHEDSRELLSFIFDEEGAEVIAVSSTSEALEVLEQTKPDILISDLIMPEEDGYSLIRKVRSREGGKSTPIPAIAVSAAAKREDQKRALLAGFHSYLSKPVNLDDLIARVASFFESESSYHFDKGMQPMMAKV